MNAKNIDKAPNCYKTLIVLQDFQNIKIKSNGLIEFPQSGYNCFKTNFSKIFTKEAFYRVYEKFNRLTFKRELEERLNQLINE